MNHDFAPAAHDRETLTIMPAEAGSGAPGIPCAIHEIDVLGVLSQVIVKAAKVGGAADAKGRELSAEIGVTTASITRASLPWELHCGDRVRRRNNGAVFEVKNVMPDGVAHLVLHLVPLDPRIDD